MKHSLPLALLSGIALCTTTGAIALSAEPTGEPSVARDLTSVIALLGLPCGEVVSVQNLGENDHVATCKDGNRYRVHVNPEGRVVAEKR